MLIVAYAEHDALLHFVLFPPIPCSHFDRRTDIGATPERCLNHP
jgi:hypothetical protein